MNPTHRTFAGLPFWLAGLGALIVVLLRGAVPFALVSDHAYFLPASWWFASGGRLANPWMQPGFDRVLDWHGFVQPWLIGEGARLLGGGWTGVRLALDLTAAATILTVPFVARALGVTPWRAAVAVVVTVALMLDARSRPEVLATLETVLLVLLTRDFATTYPVAWGRAAAIGILCGLLALTHPVAAVFACLAVDGTLVVLSVERRPPVGRLLGLPAVMGVAFAATLAALFVFVFDDRISVWLDGMARAGAITFARTDTTGFARYYLANRFLPGFAVVLVPALLVLWALRTPPATVRSVWPRRVVLVVIGLAAAWMVQRFALRIPATYYNVTAILVAVVLIAAVAPLSGLARRVADLGVAVVGAGALAGTLVWTAQALEDLPAMARSRAELSAAVLADHAAGRRLCADAAALAAIDAPDVARAITVSIPLADGPKAPSPERCDVYYALQMQDGQTVAPPVAGFTADRSTRRGGLLGRIGLRPSHFGFTRWTADRAG